MYGMRLSFHRALVGLVLFLSNQMESWLEMGGGGKKREGGKGGMFVEKFKSSDD